MYFIPLVVFLFMLTQLGSSIEDYIMIFGISGTMLLAGAVFAVVWTKKVIKERLFKGAPIEAVLINIDENAMDIS